MKNTLTLVVLACLIGITACGTTKNSEGDKTSKRALRQEKKLAEQFEKQKREREMLYIKLNLNNEQVEQFEAISLKHSQEMSDITQEHKNDRKELQSQLQRAGQNHDLQIRGILSPTQYELFLLHKKEKMEEMQRKQQIRRPQGRY